MSKDKEMKRQGKEWGEELNNVSGGAIDKRLMGGRGVYDVSEDKTGKVRFTVKNFETAKDIDDRMNGRKPLYKDGEKSSHWCGNDFI